MQCNNPITLIGKGSKDSKERLVVPCGKCLGCKIAKAREWAIRIIHELDSWERSMFITLTYRDECLPKSGSIKVKVLKDFWKRVRKNLKRKVKYYGCGEYGEERGRPHYHAIIFGVGVDEHQIVTEGYNKGLVLDGPLCRCWKFGNIHAGLVSYESARYVAQYIDKKYYGIVAKEYYLDNGLVVPFQVVSRGLGLDFVKKNKAKLENELCVSVFGKKLSLPRYYRQHLDISDKVFQDMAEDATIVTNLKLARENLDFSKIEGLTIDDLKELTAELKKSSDVNREATLLAKSKLFKRQKLS